MRQLNTNEIHIHKLELSKTREIEQFAKLLSPDETAKSRRLKNQKAQQNYIIVRGTLRQKLAEYLGTNPQKIEFSYSETGKPFLRTYPEIAFNLSHSSDYALFAFARNAKLGIDIEKIRSINNFKKLTSRFFSTEQILEIRNSINPTETFFQLWTRKEAYIKAVGTTIFSDLKTMNLSTQQTQI